MPDLDSYPAAPALAPGDRILVRQTDLDGATRTRKALLSSVGAGIALTHHQCRARTGPAQGGRRLHDLHAVGTLEGKADVGGHEHFEG